MTHSLTLHCSPLPAKHVLQLGEMLDEGHHLSLEALGVDILDRGHLQDQLDVKLTRQERIRLPIPGGAEQSKRSGGRPSQQGTVAT